MPSDTKRINGPENTRNPFVFGKIEQKPELLDENGRREDGRKPEQIRPIFAKAGIVSQAKGSAYIEMGQTKVICTVYGPRQTRREDFSMKGQLSCEYKFATFSCQRRRQHQPDTQERDHSVLLLDALQPAVRLEKFPKAQLDIFVTVLQNDGSALAGSITAASIALADAGIQMYDLVVAVTLRQSGNTRLMDPCENESYKPMVASDESVSDGNVTVGLMPTLDQVSALVQLGQMDQDTVVSAIKKCTETCHRIYPVVQQCLVNSVKKKFQERLSPS